VYAWWNQSRTAENQEITIIEPSNGHTESRNALRSPLGRPSLVTQRMELKHVKRNQLPFRC
jgi:hypothetical protein